MPFSSNRRFQISSCSSSSRFEEYLRLNRLAVFKEASVGAQCTIRYFSSDIELLLFYRMAVSLDKELSAFQQIRFHRLKSFCTDDVSMGRTPVRSNTNGSSGNNRWRWYSKAFKAAPLFPANFRYFSPSGPQLAKELVYTNRIIKEKAKTVLLS